MDEKYAFIIIVKNVKIIEKPIPIKVKKNMKAGEREGAGESDL